MTHGPLLLGLCSVTGKRGESLPSCRPPGRTAVGSRTHTQGMEHSTLGDAVAPSPGLRGPEETKLPT